jgi:hypothetical protein
MERYSDRRQGLWIHSLNSLQQHLSYRFLPSTRFFSPSEFEVLVGTPLFSYKNQRAFLLATGIATQVSVSRLLLPGRIDKSAIGSSRKIE